MAVTQNNLQGPDGIGPVLFSLRACLVPCINQMETVLDAISVSLKRNII